MKREKGGSGHASSPFSRKNVFQKGRVLLRWERFNEPGLYLLTTCHHDNLAWESLFCVSSTPFLTLVACACWAT